MNDTSTKVMRVTGFDIVGGNNWNNIFIFDEHLLFCVRVVSTLNLSIKWLRIFLRSCARAAFSPQRHLSCYSSNSSITIILEGTFQVLVFSSSFLACMVAGPKIKILSCIFVFYFFFFLTFPLIGYLEENLCRICLALFQAALVFTLM